MQSSLESIKEELIRLKYEGVRSVYIEDSTLTDLREKVSTMAQVRQVKPLEPTPTLRVEIPKDDRNFRAQTQPLTPEPEISNLPKPPVLKVPEGDKLFRWNWLKDHVLACSVCNEHLNPGKKVVFGAGNLDADILFCGEAPGVEEETLGEPFVGAPGQLLTKIISAMGFERKDVYLANIMNWRPDAGTPFSSRPPTQHEMNFCLPYLRAQVDIVKPKVIVALGASAVSGLLGVDKKRRMAQVRGEFFDFGNTPLLITFHPSYLLKNNTLRTKRQVWEDMMKVMDLLSLEISDKQRNFFT